MTDDANKQTDNAFALKAAHSLAVERRVLGAGFGAGVLLLLAGMFLDPGILKIEANCGGLGAIIGASVGLNAILEQRPTNRSPKKTAGSGPKPPSI